MSLELEAPPLTGEAENLDYAALIDLLPPGDDAAWLPTVREKLALSWRTGRAARDEPRICVLANAIASGKGHLSLPCSIADDDQSIERFLATPRIDRDPITFTRLFLFLLDDFVETLGSCYKFLGWKKAPRAPEILGTWTNYFAKHRKNIAVLHHPKYLFLDHPDADRWDRATKNAADVTVIDQSWFDGRTGLPDPEHVRANDQPAVVLVPELHEFLEAATSYYDDFVRQATGRSELKRFETMDHGLGFETLLGRLAPHLPGGHVAGSPSHGQT